MNKDFQDRMAKYQTLAGFRQEMIDFDNKLKSVLHEMNQSTSLIDSFQSGCDEELEEFNRKL